MSVQIRKTAAAVAVVATCTASTATAADESLYTEDQVRALVAEMLADADNRTSLLQSSGTAGHDGKFYLASNDGAFRLNIWGYTQFRYYANWRDDGDDSDEFEGGFQNARVRLVFSGKLYDELSFMIKPAAGASGDWGLLDAWVKYDFDDSPWALQWGQFKLPIWREWIQPEQKLQAIERSLVTSVFSSMYNQGVQLKYGEDQFRWNLVYSDGMRSANTDFTNDIEADYAFTTNIEYLGAGTWDMFSDFTSLGNTEAGWMIDASFHHQGETEDYQGAGVKVDTATLAAATFSYEGTDWNAAAGGVFRHLELADASDVDEYAFLAQAGVFLNDNWELYGRYDVIFPDSDADNDDPFNTITAGANYYMHGHAAKLSFDVVYFVDDPNDSDVVGLSEDTNVGFLDTEDDGQFVVRAQFQLVF